MVEARARAWAGGRGVGELSPMRSPCVGFDEAANERAGEYSCAKYIWDWQKRPDWVGKPATHTPNLFPMGHSLHLLRVYCVVAAK